MSWEGRNMELREEFNNLMKNTVSEIVPTSGYQRIDTLGGLIIPFNIPWFKMLPNLRKMKFNNVFNLFPTANIIDTDTKYDTFTSNYYYSCEKVYAIFVVGEGNNIVGGTKINGDIVFYTNPLFEIFEESKTLCEELIIKICKFTKKTKEAYFNNDDIEFCKNDMISTMLLDVLSKTKHVGNIKDNLETITDNIERFMRDFFIGDDTRSLSYMINQNSLYRDSISEILRARENEESRILERGIIIGSKFFAGLQRSGYIYNVSDGKWEKEINLNPEFCIYESQLYKIPEKYRVWKIPTLSYDPTCLQGENFILHTSKDSKHPNISPDFQVCIGTELTERFTHIIRGETMMVQDYANFLKEVEEALKIINFDSAYHPLSFYNSNLSYSKLDCVSMDRLKTENPKGLRRV